MIRRTFLRRMASAAMAGMLGAELMWRAPKVQGNAWVANEDLVELWHDGNPDSYGVITMIEHETNTITVEWT